MRPLPSTFVESATHHPFPYTGTKVAGHRGYYLTGDGVDLNQALISYGLNFLRDQGFKKIQAPFFMNKSMMSKTAQLSEFDEALYKVRFPLLLPRSIHC